MTGRSRLKTLGCAFLLAVCGTAAAMVLAEIGVRIFVPQVLLHDPDAFMPDATLGARLKPGFNDRVVTSEFASTWAINEDGHRGPRAARASGAAADGDAVGPGDTAERIVALGDSFTFGYGVEEEEAWPRRLEAILAEEEAGERVEVVILGVGGYGTWEETRYLEQERARLAPDLVLVAFYFGNDPVDNRRWYPPVPVLAAGDAPAAEAGADRAERVKRWLGARLHLYNLIASRGDELLVRTGLRRLVYPFEIDVLRSPPPESVAAAWEATRAAFTMLTHMQESGLAIRVVLVPMRHQVDDAFWQRLTAQYERLAGARAVRALDRDRPQRIVEDLLLDAKIESFDLLPGLRAAARRSPDPLYWSRDQHWTQAGHAAAARLIADRLRSEGLFPSRIVAQD